MAWLYHDVLVLYKYTQCWETKQKKWGYVKIGKGAFSEPHETWEVLSHYMNIYDCSVTGSSYLKSNFFVGLRQTRIVAYYFNNGPIVHNRKGPHCVASLPVTRGETCGDEYVEL